MRALQLKCKPRTYGINQIRCRNPGKYFTICEWNMNQLVDVIPFHLLIYL